MFGHEAEKQRYKELAAKEDNEGLTQEEMSEHVFLHYTLHPKDWQSDKGFSPSDVYKNVDGSFKKNP